jgi:hypothetical protein
VWSVSDRRPTALAGRGIFALPPPLSFSSGILPQITLPPPPSLSFIIYYSLIILTIVAKYLELFAASWNLETRISEILGFHGGDYEEWWFLQEPHDVTSQKTPFIRNKRNSSTSITTHSFRA